MSGRIDRLNWDPGRKRASASSTTRPARPTSQPKDGSLGGGQAPAAPDLHARRGPDARHEARPGRGRVPLLDPARRLQARPLHRRGLRRRARPTSRRSSPRCSPGCETASTRWRSPTSGECTLLRRRSALPRVADADHRAQGRRPRAQRPSTGSGRSSERRAVTPAARRRRGARARSGPTSPRTCWSRRAPAPARPPRSSAGSSRSSPPATRPSTSSPSITFTHKAAAELSARVREELEEAIPRETDPARRERLAAAARGLYRARIETIHSFATSLLRERPVEAGLDPEFRTLDGLEAELLFDDGSSATGSPSSSPRTAPGGRRPRSTSAWAPTSCSRRRVLVHEHRYLLPLQPFEVEAGRRLGGGRVARGQPATRSRGSPSAAPTRSNGRSRRSRGCSSSRERLEVEGTSAARPRAARSPARCRAVSSGAASQSDWDDPDDCRRWKRSSARSIRSFASGSRSQMRSAALAGAAAADRGVRPRLRGSAGARRASPTSTT